MSITNIPINSCFVYPIVTRQDINVTDDSGLNGWKRNSSLNTERNISATVSAITDFNFVLSGLGIQYSSGNVTVQKGSAIIGGHLITLFNNVVITPTTDSKIYLTIQPVNSTGGETPTSDDGTPNALTPTLLGNQQKIDNTYTTQGSVQYLNGVAFVTSPNSDIDYESDFYGNQLLVAIKQGNTFVPPTSQYGFTPRGIVSVQSAPNVNSSKLNGDSVVIRTYTQNDGNGSTTQQITNFDTFILTDLLNSLRFTCILDDGDYDKGQVNSIFGNNGKIPNKS